MRIRTEFYICMYIKFYLLNAGREARLRTENDGDISSETADTNIIC